MVSPTQDAAVPVNAAGVAFVYTRPTYTSIDGLPGSGGRRDYSVRIATSPDVGSDQRLLQANTLNISPAATFQDPDLPVGQRRGWLTKSPEVMTPGTGRRRGCARHVPVRMRSPRLCVSA